MSLNKALRAKMLLFSSWTRCSRILVLTQERRTILRSVTSPPPAKSNDPTLHAPILTGHSLRHIRLYQEIATRMFAHDHPLIAARPDHKSRSGVTEQQIVVAQALAPAEVGQPKNLISSLILSKIRQRRARPDETRSRQSWTGAVKH